MVSSPIQKEKFGGWVMEPVQDVPSGKRMRTHFFSFALMLKWRWEFFEIVARGKRHVKYKNLHFPDNFGCIEETLLRYLLLPLSCRLLEERGGN